MHKIFPLLAASIIASLSGAPTYNAIIVKPGRSSRSKDFPGISGVEQMSLEDSLKPFIPGSFYYQSSAPVALINDYFSCPKYGSFPLGLNTSTEVTFTYELNTLESQTIIERVRLFRNGSVVAAVTNGSFSYTKGTRKDVTFTLPIKDYWTTNGLEIRFEIMNTSYTVIKSFSSSFYPPRNGLVSASTLKGAIYTSNSLGFYGNGEQMKELKEIYDFRNIGDYIDNDYYYRLDISKNNFLYPNDLTFSYKSAKLRFNDSGYVFPYYTHQNNDDVEIPLKLTRDGNCISFAFDRTFYVNRRTLEVSDVYQSGWVMTPHFYLPVNGRKKLNGKTMYFELNELGYDKISTIIPLRYELDRTIIGVCTDGDFCVVGGDH